MQNFDINRENHIINWLNRVEGYGDSCASSFDKDLPSHRCSKPIKKDKYKNSKRFFKIKQLKEEAKICAICGSTKSLVVDHCHFSRKIRGVICDSCNKGLGNFRDDPKVMRKAIQYLKIAKENENEALDYYTFKISPQKSRIF